MKTSALSVVLFLLAIAALFAMLRHDFRVRRTFPPRWDPKEGDRVRLKRSLELYVGDKPLTLVDGHVGTIRLRAVNDDIVWYVRFDHGPQAVPFTPEELPCLLEPL